MSGFCMHLAGVTCDNCRPLPGYSAPITAHVVSCVRCEQRLVEHALRDADLLARAERAEAARDKAWASFDEMDTLTRSLYRHVQDGAGCCGKAIGRGSRLSQLLEAFNELRARPGVPPYLSREWLPPAEAKKLTEERDRAEAAAAQLREALQVATTPLAKDRQEGLAALSTDCGKGWLSPEKVARVRAVLKTLGCIEKQKGPGASGLDFGCRVETPMDPPCAVCAALAILEGEG